MGGGEYKFTNLNFVILMILWIYIYTQNRIFKICKKVGRLVSIFYDLFSIK